MRSPTRLYSIRYDVQGGGEVVVATVRPETMLGDTAVAVNPDDERHRHLVGSTAILPLVGRELPIVADEYVKVDFGTGALKITPGHDANDFEIGRRHGLEQVTVIGEDGRMTADAGERFAGLEVAAAREAVVSALREEGRIVEQREHAHEVPFSHRSGARIEPLISLQWFMRMDELAAPAIEAVTSGQVRIHPEGQRGRYLSWLEEIRPWCISRQLWWGHRLPVHYCDSCEETYVAATAPERCGACDGPLRQDEDVLDTWFSSALWPFATLGWPRETRELAAFYPTDVLLTARDILFLWVARMVMMGVRFTGQVPFSDVYVHSIIQAPDGRRMSKSLGTGIDPIEEIDRHGADAVRFGLLAMSSSQDVRYSAEKVEQGQRLANKLWNASRLILLNADGQTGAPLAPRALEDRWIVSRLQRARLQTAERVAAFDFSHAALGLYDFVYGELCDWYLELVKPRLYGDGADADDLPAILLGVLEQTLEMAHPVIPFVTEEIWSYLPGAEGLLAGRQVQRGDSALIDDQAEQEVERAIAAVREVRGWRDGAGVAAGGMVSARLEASGYEATAAQVARLARLELTADGGDPQARVAIPGGSLAVFAGGGFDPAQSAERDRRRRDALEQQIAHSQGKLANHGFVERAPAEVVAREREKLERLRGELESL